MNWYYVENGQQAGPIDDTQLGELLRSGRIQPDTLVWREGMPDWARCAEATGESQVSVGPPRLTSTSQPGVAAGATEAACTECGRVFPRSEMIRYGAVHVCAACKPVFMQKIQEGAGIMSPRLNYAGFWIRFAAVFLDGVLLWVFNVGISLLAGLTFGQAVGFEPTETIGLQLALMAVQILIGLSYEVVLIGRFGATLGKMALGLKVVTAENGKVSYFRSLGRYFAKLLSGFTCMIGYIMAAFDDEKRSLHDRICNTRVVFK